ncbi:APC family permease [Streptomyces sp. 351MFTsu5.1]|uniref:APC family permease n=1 Tax=Streptomyces sp. 351MFTsu5.1 TaxID=1172180 RepID=UPI00039C6A3A|nr:APC family permease [Streptomyces sp. 351MFTsu5.1]
MSTASEAADAEVAMSSESTASLRGNMGVLELIFTVVAYNGPVVVFLGFIPVAILLGNGVGTPVAFLACGVIVAMLAVGLLTMSARLKRPGGFYALITAGLGRVVGLGSGFAALTCYFVALLSAYALGGIALNTVIVDIFHGPKVAWWAWAGLMLVVTSVLGHFNISFSSRVLTVFLACELLLMIAYDVSVFAKGGAHGIGFDSFTPHQIFSGSTSIAFLFGMGLFGGFEATVIFRDEVRKPERTIPVATYGVVALLASLYAVTAWCFINSYGAAAVMDAVNKDLVGASTNSIKEYTGQFAYDAATVMLFTSSFALALAAHNITARYVFNLGADGIFPRRFGRPHERHASPHRASFALSVTALLVLAVFVVADVPEADLYARLAGLYSYAFVILLVLVALAIGAYLLRDRVHGKAVGPAVASLVAFIVLCVTLVLATKNFTLLTGATGTTKDVLIIVIWGVTLAGTAWAFYLRRNRAEIYSSIGRQ